MTVQTYQQQIKIPQGEIYKEINLDTLKIYIAKEYDKIIYIDRNSHTQENPTLTLKFLPNGAKTAPYPQIVGYFRTNQYHLEPYLYAKKDPKTWSTICEFHIKLTDMLQILECTTKACLELPNFYSFSLTKKENQ